MMTNPTPTQRLKAVHRFNERVQSLIDDGYHIAFCSSGMYSKVYWATLRHHNGNRVTIRAFLLENRIEQRTNHVLTHEGALY